MNISTRQALCMAHYDPVTFQVSGLVPFDVRLSVCLQLTEYQLHYSFIVVLSCSLAWLMAALEHILRTST